MLKTINKVFRMIKNYRSTPNFKKVGTKTSIKKFIRHIASYSLYKILFLLKFYFENTCGALRKAGFEEHVTTH